MQKKNGNNRAEKTKKGDGGMKEKPDCFGNEEGVIIFCLECEDYYACRKEAGYEPEDC